MRTSHNHLQLVRNLIFKLCDQNKTCQTFAFHPFFLITVFLLLLNLYPRPNVFLLDPLNSSIDIPPTETSVFIVSGQTPCTSLSVSNLTSRQTVNLGRK